MGALLWTMVVLGCDLCPLQLDENHSVAGKSADGHLLAESRNQAQKHRGVVEIPVLDQW